MALGLDLRLPTGDEKNLLGTGAPGVQPFLVWSGNYGVVAPHLNAGYQWNGSSVLGGDPGSGISADLPDVGRIRPARWSRSIRASRPPSTSSDAT